jgi:flagellar motor switch/type III secretory pathway protein FliN
MKTRPIELLGESDLLRSRQTAAQALEAWRAVWGLGPREARIACVRAWESGEPIRPDEKGWLGWVVGEGAGWAAASPEFACGLRQGLFGPAQAGASEHDTSIALELCNLAIEDLVVRLLAGELPSALRKCEQGSAPVIPAGVFEHGSGAVVTDIQIEEGRLLAITLRIPRFRQDPAGSQSFGESHGAMRAVPVPLDAQLGELDIELGTLQSLEVGDVIRLPAKLDQPLRLLAPGGGTVCFGDFGTQEGFRALSLRKSAAHEGA